MTYPQQNFDREQYLEKPLPSRPESEQAVLGAILVDNALIADALEIVTAEDFYSPLHRKIFRAMTVLFERSQQIDPILIGELLAQDGQLEAIGGVATISNLLRGVHRISNIAEYAEVVREKAIARNLIKACNLVTSTTLAEEESIFETLDRAEQAVYELRTNEQDKGMSPLGAEIENSFHEVQENARTGKEVLGLSTGFTELDRITAGLQETDLIVIAGRPSMGKSAVVADIVRGVTKKQSEAVCALFSLEMSKKQFANRMLCAEAEVDSQRYRLGNLSREEWSRIAEAASSLYDRKIFIDDRANLSALEIKAKARKVALKEKRLDLIAIDYLQIMGAAKAESRQQEVSQIARDLKAMAKDLKVPVIALSQLSRECEKRNPPKPRMSDLRDSGSIEQEADIVALMYREEYYNRTDENMGVAEMIIGKNRNGATGAIKLAFLNQFSKFADIYSDY